MLAVGGTIAALAFADVALTAGSASAATANDLYRLRMCESGGNYAINTGNGFYGAYQFDQGTWSGLGLSGRPDYAAPSVQDGAVYKLQSQRGWQPWPACSRKLGLGSGISAAPAPRATYVPRAAPAPRATYVSRATRSRTVAPRPALRTAGVPAFDGHVLSASDVASYRGDVATWQRRMAQRGWNISVDGAFGPQSAGVASRFAAEKGVAAARGTVNAAGWHAAWVAPIT